MIRMMILTMSVVLLATFDYLHATACSTGLESYMKTMCIGLRLGFLERSDCTFTCEGVNSAGQNQTTQLKLVDGLPCGSCKECCDGTCTLVHFSSLYPPTLKSCAK
uniref:Putative secreted protein n=2 Tax=Ixodes ricinus TaxID=34613 RepID=V5HCV9_IXORI